MRSAALDTHKALVHIFFSQRTTKKVCEAWREAKADLTSLSSGSAPGLPSCILSSLSRFHASHGLYGTTKQQQSPYWRRRCVV